MLEREVAIMKPLVKMSKETAKVFFAGTGEEVEISLYNSNWYKYFHYLFKHKKVGKKMHYGLLLKGLKKKLYSTKKF